MGSGGGGSSGAVDFPTYMKSTHAQWLDHDGTDVVSSSITDLINSNLAASPYATAAPYDPTTDLADMVTAIGTQQSAVAVLAGDDLGTLINTSMGWVSSYLLSDAVVGATVVAHSAQLQDEIDDEILPAFRTSMRDVGMVNTSAFTIGEAILAARKLKHVASADAELRKLQAVQRTEVGVKLTELANNSELRKTELLENVYKLKVDISRMSIVSWQEHEDKDVEYDELDAKWPFEMYSYAGNLLASISGAAGPGGGKGTSKMQSAIGGALSGAAMGAQMGSVVPGMGTAAGAAIGGGVGLLGGLL